MSKLVRDKIPDIIRQSGREPDIRRISGDELNAALKNKLVEEALELRDADDIYEELADVLEVIDALLESQDIDLKKVLEIKAEKLSDSGGFEEGYLLVDVGEKHKAPGEQR
jgi:predicted house-cleaning noncanonical NTP pyrophosphatase (MazG superfamily)